MIAVLAVTTTVVGGVGFNRISGFPPSPSLFSCAIMFVAWSRGTGPAVMATTLTILAFDYFFLPPVYSFSLHLKDVPQLVLFAVAAFFVMSLCESQRRTIASLRRARDQQQLTLRELQQTIHALHLERTGRKLAEQRAHIAEGDLKTYINYALAACVAAPGELKRVDG